MLKCSYNFEIWHTYRGRHLGSSVAELVQERCNSSVLVMELLLSCTNPSKRQSDWKTLTTDLMIFAWSFDKASYAILKWPPGRCFNIKMYRKWQWRSNGLKIILSPQWDLLSFLDIKMLPYWYRTPHYKINENSYNGELASSSQNGNFLGTVSI